LDLRRLSYESARLLSLLRAVDQKGMECPYIHQVNKQLLERALDKCQKLKEAGSKYFEGKGLWARLTQLLNKIHLDAAGKDLDSFKSKLEAVLLMCRHQEFAQDLVKLRSVAFDYSVRPPVTKAPQPKLAEKQAALQQPSQPQPQPQPQPQRGAFRLGPMNR
jgi:hypothetical protein